MTRKKIARKTEIELMLSARRRCCICFGLNRDTNLKSGQIAHLDKNNSNNDIDNLAFLCFEHHDEYDSKTSQRKGLLIEEVKTYRQELYDAVGKQFSIVSRFGQVEISPPEEDPIAGTYVRFEGDQVTAEINVFPIPASNEGMPRYVITGWAVWGIHREFGPNIGDLSFIGIYDKKTIENFAYTPHNPDIAHHIRLKFEGEKVVITEKNHLGIYGMNVSFIGTFYKASF
jgi:hypothetical protein